MIGGPVINIDLIDNSEDNSQIYNSMTTEDVYARVRREKRERSIYKDLLSRRGI